MHEYGNYTCILTLLLCAADLVRSIGTVSICTYCVCNMGEGDACMQAVGEAAAAVTATTSAVTSAVGGAVTAAEASLSATTAAVWGAVPEPAQGALVQVRAPFLWHFQFSFPAWLCLCPVVAALRSAVCTKFVECACFGLWGTGGKAGGVRGRALLVVLRLFHIVKLRCWCWCRVP